eukprot:3839742-Lingulodinium_polyedra.AAC.1
MPPLEAKKILFRMAVASREQPRRGGSGSMKLAFVDVKKAHLNGVVGEDEFVYVSLPDEAEAGGRCGKLRKWLYGMRPAAGVWEKDYSDRMAKIGFKK